MAEPLTIALILEARDNASEWIDRVRENVSKLQAQAEEASKSVAESADQMSASLDKDSASTDANAESMDKDAVATDRATEAQKEQKLAQDDATAATDKNTISKDENGTASEDAAKKTSLFSKATDALALAFIGVGVVAAKMAIDFQTATTSLATHAGITTKQANAIGNAFLNTGGKVTFTASQMMTAFAPVAGEFVNMDGKALSVHQSMQFMTASMNLAEASGGDLTVTTKALADAMMVFHLKVGQAASASNMMWNASRLLGVSTDSLAQSLARLEPRIAGSGMTLKQTTGFMVELSKSAGGGRQAMRIAGQAIQQLVSPSTSAQKALAELGVVLTNSNGKFIGITAAIGKIHDALAHLPGTTKDVVAMQKAYRLQIQLSQMGLEAQTKSLKKQETAISTQISALDQSTKSLSKNTLMQSLFSRQAGLMTSIVLGGVPAFTKATNAVAKSGEVSKAAAAQDKTFHGMLEKLKSAAEDLFIKIGQKLLPVLITLAKKTLDVTNAIINWIEHNQTLTEVILGIVGGVLVLIKTIELIKLATEAWAAAQAILDAALMANPIGIVIAILALLVAGVIWATLHFSYFRTQAVLTWTAIRDAWSVAVKVFTAIWHGIANTATALWSTLKSGASTAEHAVTDAWSAMTHFFSTLWHDVSSAASTGWTDVRDAWDAASSWFDTEIVQPIVRFFSTLWTDLSGGAVNAWKSVVSAWNAAVSWFNTEIIQPIERLFKQLWQDITGGVTHAVNTVKNVISDVTGFFGGIVSGVAKGYDAIKNTATSVLGIAKQTTDSVNKTSAALHKTATGTTRNVHIRHLAEGGMVTSPTLAVVGEAGPEMVIPLSGLPSGAVQGGVAPLPTGGSSGGGTQVNIYLTMSGQVYGDLNQALNAMGRQLATVLVPGSGTRLTTR